MNLWPFKHQTCPLDEDDAVLLVDVETESVPLTDEHGNMLYYCLEGEHTFPVAPDVYDEQDSRKKRR